MDASKYSFKNVLVANTRLLANMNELWQRPPVLVLNSKLNKCPQQGSSFGHSNSCESCCLQAERPEFRRYLSTGPTSVDCFASCSQRRPIDIELKTKAHISGRLVILALTRLESASWATNLDRGPSRCLPEATWSYGRFNTTDFDEPTHKIIDNERRHQTYYARLGPNQVPSIMFDSADINWSVEADQATGLRTHRELVDLAIQSGHQNNGRQEVVNKETLIVTSMNCYLAKTVPALSAPFQLTPEVTTEFVGKIYLLALINRGLTTGQVTPLPATQTRPIPTSGSAYESRDQEVHARPKGVEIFTPPGDRGDDTQSKRAVLENSNQTTTTESIRRQLSSEVSAKFELPTISRRADSSSAQISTTDSTLRPPLPTLPVMNPYITRNGSRSESSLTRFGPPYLTEPFDSLRLRLRSSSLMVLTVSSSFVILTYTLCLLIYLKSRNRTRRSPHDSKVEVRPKESDIVMPKVSSQLTSAPTKALEISEPFNLQMPAETQSRLRMMKLKVNIGEHSSQINNNNRSLQSYLRSENDNEWRAGGWSKGPASKKNEHEFNNTSGHPSTSSLKLSAQQQMETQRSRQQYLNPNSAYLNFGTVRLVRAAISQAASLAKSKLHYQRYQSNLNVIPESDLEYLQPSQNGRLELFVPVPSHQLSSHLMGDTRRDGSILQEHFESLVQEAISPVCSHAGTQQNFLVNPSTCTTTLFSRPIAQFGPNATNAVPVSRSRILRRVIQTQDTESEKDRNLNE